MRFPKGCKLERCAAREAGRYNFHNVLVEQGESGPVAVATDGRKLVVLPLALEEGEEPPIGQSLVPREAFAQAAKGHRGEDARLTVDPMAASARVENGCASEYRQGNGEFPRYRAVLPQGAPEYRIAFNAKYLLDIAQALACETVVLEFRGKAEPIEVKPFYSRIEGESSPFAEGREPRAILMPVTLSDTPTGPVKA